MKVAIVICALLAISTSAPQPRKIFHEHFDDFLDLIWEEAGEDIEHLMEHYLEFEEFAATLNYLKTNNFKDLVYEMESLPEFVAVLEFLEKDNIDIHFFIDNFNSILDEVKRSKALTSKHTLRGTDFTSFVYDSIDEFPKEKLQALFEEKQSEDPDFKSAIDNLYSDEWQQVFGALWANADFQKEVATLGENGIQVNALLTEIKAVFGQN